MSRRKRYAALAVLATAAVAGGILAGASAGPSEPPVLTDVATANTRSDGYAPASKLSVELRQVVVAQGSTKLDGGPSSAGSIGYYGYDNDTLNAAGEPQMVPTPAAPNTEAHKTEPDKNTYLVFKNGLPGADPHYDYGTHFLFQGHEAGAPGYITRINLDADAAHRVTLLATKDATGANHRATSTARRGIRGPSGCCSRPRTRTPRPTRPRRATRPRSPTSPARSAAAATRASRTTPTATSGSSRTSAARTRRARAPRSVPNSFVYRYVPQDPGDLANGKLQVLQVLNAAGDPITQASQTRAQHARPGGAAHLRRELQDELGDHPRHRRRRHRSVRRERARDGREGARRSSGRRTGFRPARRLQGVLLRRDRRHERDQPGERDAGGWGASSS